MRPGPGRVSWRAPGRVNLIGDHTDYAGGLALPFAINRTARADVGLRGPVGTGWRATSVQLGTVTVGEIDGLASLPPEASWARYVLGPLAVLAAEGVQVPALEVRVDSEVPSGGGLSSSAAVICSVLAAVDELLDLALSAQEQVSLAVRVENEVVGAPTGGLDQLVAVHAVDAHALVCDFADPARPTHAPVPLELDEQALTLVVLDTGVRHRHADGQYAARRRSTDAGAGQLGLPSLGTLASDDLARALGELPDLEVRRRVRHVVTENARVREVVALLRRGRIGDIGPVLTASHESLRDDHEVSCPELDLAVRAACDAGALGARMTGGGFGGCVVALVGSDDVDEVVGAVTQAFRGAALEAPQWFTPRPSPGTRRVRPSD